MTNITKQAIERMSVQEITQIVQHTEFEAIHTLKGKLKHDQRKGVQLLYQRLIKKEAEYKGLKQRWQEMSYYEQDLRQQGFQGIAGIDEVGRGPLAGPVVAAAVILPEGFELLGLDDSKKLSKEKRASYSEYIKAHALEYHLAFIDSEVIDEVNIYQATLLAMQKAANHLQRMDVALIDAMKPNLHVPIVDLIKGDQKSISIAAASVIAKEARDQYMAELAQQYPHYHFDKNVGYPTAEHIAAIKAHGLTPIHRRTFVKGIVEV